MADAPGIVHQIEYRWHERRDLSPIASTMSQDSLRGWDSSIRGWVRHPHVEGLKESLCYQILANGRAALAWRYEDWQAAEREDGTQGRPLVSRVLVGQARALNPGVAIVLCRTGLPATFGPRPGRVTSGTQLAAIAAGELNALARKQTAGLDREAAQQEGLAQVVVAALHDPGTPLAIQLRDTDILKPPGEGVQCPLLWGLWKIVYPLLGLAGRDWSFSTFEPPLGGTVNPATLPDILFRQAQDGPMPPLARPRKEIKCRPFDLEQVLDPEGPDGAFSELARWLVAEYQEQGGEGLKQAIADWCVGEQSPSLRYEKVYFQLRVKYVPDVTSDPSTLPRSVAAEADPAEPAPAESKAAPVEPTTAESDECVPFAADQPLSVEDDCAVTEQQPSPAQADAEADEADDVTDVDADEALRANRVAEQDRQATAFAYSSGGPSQHPATQQPVSTVEYEDASRTRHTGEYPADSGYAEKSAYPGEQNYAAEEYRDDGYTDQSVRPTGPDIPYQAPIQDQVGPGYSEVTWPSQENSSLRPPREGVPRQLSGRSQEPDAPTGKNQPIRIAGGPPMAISELLKRLPAAVDDQDFDITLRDICDPDTLADSADRVRARREVSKIDWYDAISAKFGEVLDIEVLSFIFQRIVIPDLNQPDVVKKVNEWMDDAQPAVVGGLLLAALESGHEAGHTIVQLLQPKLAHRWAIAHGFPSPWEPRLITPPGPDTGRRSFNPFRRGG